MIVPGVTK